MDRALREFRIRGVATNLTFLEAIITHPKFRDNSYATKSIDTTPELFAQVKRRDRATKLLTYLADVTINGENIGTSPLVGSAKTQWNASVFYEKHGVLMRASYNRKGEQVGGIVSGLNVYSAPYEQVDLNGQVNITPQITLTASVINLTKSEQMAHLGNDTDLRYYSSQYTGRRF